MLARKLGDFTHITDLSKSAFPTSSFSLYQTGILSAQPFLHRSPLPQAPWPWLCHLRMDV